MKNGPSNANVENPIVWPTLREFAQLPAPLRADWLSQFLSKLCNNVGLHILDSNDQRKCLMSLHRHTGLRGPLRAYELPDFTRGGGKIATNEKLVDHNEMQVGCFLA